MKKYTIWINLILIVLFANGCIESIDFQSETFDNHLVVSSILTNEFKNHTVELSRTVPIDSVKIQPEENAIVTIIDDLGTTYNFQENESGLYISTEEFAAESSRSYTLKITTKDGKNYASTEETLPKVREIEDVFFTIENNPITSNQDVFFRVNSKLSEGNGNYYRYEYEETYKITPPLWSNFRIEIESAVQPYSFSLVPKDVTIYGTGTCYGNTSSKTIMLTETKTLNQDKISGLPLRKVAIDSYIIGLRYSILVRQYVLNQNTFDFYTLLDKFSDSDNIFSQVQIGNIPSNVSPESDPNSEKVIGFFEVSTINEKRVFFNRSDITDSFYQNYASATDCGTMIEPEINDGFGTSPLLDYLRTGWIFAAPHPDFPPPPNTPYLLTKKKCGDCSHLGAINRPDFWIE
ncbi:DUF4249 domain-containing protein [Tenacibaculum xiamenense]|uniref:DUF4249 domain-containing protein n=1 Tax=Tenacibaculum xiamenense TaxID=1261553 RepID=UPI0038932074